MNWKAGLPFSEAARPDSPDPIAMNLMPPPCSVSPKRISGRNRLRMWTGGFLSFQCQKYVWVVCHAAHSSPGIWNRLEWRPLEGFIFALTCFNFTSIAGNLGGAPALMGNTVVWKASRTAVYLLRSLWRCSGEAGPPDGSSTWCSGVRKQPMLFSAVVILQDYISPVPQRYSMACGNHFENISRYRSYPRIVGETGGKDYVFADATANPRQVATALIRGAFEYQGQKCWLLRAYIPTNIRGRGENYMAEDLKKIKVGDVQDFTNFVNAVMTKTVRQTG